MGKASVYCVSDLEHTTTKKKPKLIWNFYFVVCTILFSTTKTDFVLGHVVYAFVKYKELHES